MSAKLRCYCGKEKKITELRKEAKYMHNATTLFK